ncbi:hypothetical protein DL98DRAFT_46153 [Cadophora sp. DSE1049]|nr:hypothetical protein DL98DRAFT_46153 [Cadophora sp. DSE1049]
MCSDRHQETAWIPFHFHFHSRFFKRLHDGSATSAPSRPGSKFDPVPKAPWRQPNPTSAPLAPPLCSTLAPPQTHLALQMELVTKPLVGASRFKCFGRKINGLDL